MKEPTYRLVPVEEPTPKKKRKKVKEPRVKKQKQSTNYALAGLQIFWDGLKVFGRGLGRASVWVQKENQGRWGSVGPQLMIVLSIGFLVGYVYGVMR